MSKKLLSLLLVLALALTMSATAFAVFRKAMEARGLAPMRT